MTGLDVVVLLTAGVLAGVVSTVVSLASLVSYPVLLWVGLPPLAANVTNTVALVFTGVGAAVGSRPELTGQGRRVLRLGALTALGGAGGAAVLLLTPARAFETVAPWLIAGASLLLLVQPAVGRLAARGGQGAAGPGDGGRGDGPGDGGPGGGGPGDGGPDDGGPDDGPDGGPGDGGRGDGPGGGPGGGGPGGPGLGERVGREQRWPMRVAVVAVSGYTGYFGAASGIIMLAVLAPMLDLPLVRVNAVKNAIAALANGVAAVAFALFGPVRWAAVLPLAAGFLVGGWLGPALARRLPGQSLRLLVAGCGLAVAVKLGIDAYR